MCQLSGPVGAGTPPGPGDPPRLRSRSPTSKVTPLASGHITTSERITVELISSDDMPPIVKVTGPLQPTVCDPRRYAEVAAPLRPWQGSKRGGGCARPPRIELAAIREARL